MIDMNKEMMWFTFIGCYGLPMFIVSETPYSGSIWDHKNDNMKTLKDIIEDIKLFELIVKPNKMNAQFAGHFFVKELRAEAIKHLQEFYTNPKYNPNDLHGDERDSINWIKHFFGITEEGLK